MKFCSHANSNFDALALSTVVTVFCFLVIIKILRSMYICLYWHIPEEFCNILAYSAKFRHILPYSVIFRDIPAFRVFTTAEGNVWRIQEKRVNTSRSRAFYTLLKYSQSITRLHYHSIFS